jgi:hypothetical protein
MKAVTEHWRIRNGKAAGRAGQGRHVDVRSTIGAAAFARLPLAVQRRFAPWSHADVPRTYRGIMFEVSATHLGRFFAALSVLIGSPVVARTGHNIPCAVTLLHDESLGGTIWQRRYWFPEATSTVATTKRAGPTGAPVESFNRWFGMDLDIFERSARLYFVSDSYFAEVFGARIRLPRWLSPGRLEVFHEDIGDGWFRFAMTLTHPVLGVLLRQDGHFCDPED